MFFEDRNQADYRASNPIIAEQARIVNLGNPFLIYETFAPDHMDKTLMGKCLIGPF